MVSGVCGFERWKMRLSFDIKDVLIVLILDF